jgi:hypothetical protein
MIARRPFAIVMVLDAASRKQAARCAGMDRQTFRDWGGATASSNAALGISAESAKGRVGRGYTPQHDIFFWGQIDLHSGPVGAHSVHRIKTQFIEL